MFSLFDRAKSFFDRVSAAQEVQQNAERLAGAKKLREAVKIAEETLVTWSSTSSFWGQQARDVLLGNLLEELQSQVNGWKKTIHEADRLASRAQALEASDKSNPYETGVISDALNLYQQCNTLIYDLNLKAAAQRCQQELQKRQTFQNYVSQAKEFGKKGFFKKALDLFLQAKALFSLQQLDQAIASYQSKVKFEEQYEALLNRARQMAISGNFSQAFIKFKPIFQKFPRSDGKELLQQLHRVLRGKALFKAGLSAEQAKAYQVAVSNYKEAIKILPELTECSVRLAIVLLKQSSWSQALEYLQEISGEQANYLRGFAHANQGNWQEADREWRSISHSSIASQREILSELVKRDRLQAKKAISELTYAENIEEARTHSNDFIKKFGADLVLASNLEGHIKPRLEVIAWQSQNWQYIAQVTEEKWLRQPDSISLHNWAVACYYQAQVDSSKLEIWLVSWSMALVNIHLDPCLQNVPWLENSAIDFNELYAKLKQRLERAIDAVKNDNIDTYLKLRDRYRIEIVAHRLIGTLPSCALSLNQLCITPGVYHRQKNILPKVPIPDRLLRTLYTPWGEAVAACLEGDTERAIQIHPTHLAETDTERFAQQLLYYHSGCYYLQNKEWKKAVSPLKAAQEEIKSNPEWKGQIDKLCLNQRQAISEFSEHLEFAKFWHGLLESQQAKSYLAEYKAEEIRKKIVEEELSLNKALPQLKELTKIDASNPVVLDLIKIIEVAQEMEEIQQLLKRDQFEEAVARAKRSGHDKIRYWMAEICLEILLKGVEKKQLSFTFVLQLGRWAYELCPNDPNFKLIYRQLGIC